MKNSLISAFLNGVGFFEGIGAFDLIMPTRQDQRMFSRDLILRMLLLLPHNLHLMIYILLRT